MAITHLEPGNIIDIQPLGAALSATKTFALFKTDDLELIRMVLPADKVIPEHKAPGSITIQVIEGEVEFTSMGKSTVVRASQLIYLLPGEPHSVRAIVDSSFLLTIVRPSGTSST